MEERHILQMVQNLVERFEYYGADQFNLERELQQLVHPITSSEINGDVRQRIEQDFLTRVQYRRSHDGAVLLPVSVVFDPRLHEEWYDEWLVGNDNDTGSFYWKRLEDFLSRELTSKYGPVRAGGIVRSIDDATLNIMRKLANPLRREFTYKGLVVGYVQSGKTANFTALISKAADAGYRLIIVLAGIHNVLRRQTQVRLDRELTGLRDIEGPDNYISQPGPAKKWNRLTTAHNDFSTFNLGLFINYCQSETPTLAVVKKNVRVLERLISFFDQAPLELRRALPVLIIDDEADQASVDGNARDPDSDPTQTNEKIRTILGLFSKRAYVGYTATPFANVLIDMASAHNTLEDDLYPRNFIISLPQPEGYFGTSMIFQGELSNRFITEIPASINNNPYSESRTLIRGGVITENLSNAIDEFILCCAIRNLRGDKMRPMSMLVHVSHRINDMTIIKNIISSDGQTPGYIQNIIGRYRDSTQSESLKQQFRNTWTDFISDSNAINEALQLTNNIIPEFDLVWAELANVFQVLRVIELNSASEDTLDYTTDEEIKVIAIGGNQLSRGLTLEGLMTSYYLRESRQYDTLLQMGRWFGYRNRYEDLTRIHTTENIWDFFEHLALVEHELRREISRYEEEGLTPMQMAVAIRGHQNLTVTAPNKMGAGNVRQSSYSGSLSQTIWMPLDRPELLSANYNLGESFIRSIGGISGFSWNQDAGVYLSNNTISGERIIDEFLGRYNFVDTSQIGGASLDSASLIAYIRRRLNHQTPELTEWSIGVVSNLNSRISDDPISYGGLSINRIQRSRLSTSRGYNVGVLTEPSHLESDGYNRNNRPATRALLLLYLIWRDSQALVRQNSQRINLYQGIETERIDVLGFAIELPKSNSEPNDYIGQ